MSCNCGYDPVQENILLLLLEGMADEAGDKIFYEYLMDMAPNIEQRNIIKSIIEDEMKHAAMFKIIYEDLTGEEPVVKDSDRENNEQYCEGIQKAIFGELGAVEFYRKILFGLRLCKHKDMLLEIVTDEIKHSVKWNLLYTKNCVQ